LSITVPLKNRPFNNFMGTTCFFEKISAKPIVLERGEQRLAWVKIGYGQVTGYCSHVPKIKLARFFNLRLSGSHTKFTIMKAVISVSIPLVAFFAAGAWSINRPAQPLATSPANPTSAPISALVSDKAPKMWTKAATLYKNETIELQFAAPNAAYLGVVDPKGHFFYVVFPKETAEGQLKPLVDSKRFVPMTSLPINTGTLKADPYIYGVYENQPVFTQSGTYTFILGDNLHVDDPELVHKLTVKYVHKARPASDPVVVAMQ